MTAPGWYDDPWSAGQLRFWDGREWTPYAGARPHRHVSVFEEPPLDLAVVRMREQDTAKWGWRPVGIPILTLIGVVVAGIVITALIQPSTYGGKLTFAVVANTMVEAILAMSVWWAGRGIAARNGGWSAAFGWAWPRPRDFGWGAAGFGISLVLRIIVGVIANGLSGGNASREAQNLHLHMVNAAIIVLLVVVVGICAPVIEELVFRGLLLRTFMRRMAFWPAAFLSTAIFALFHVYEVDTLVGAVTLASSVGVFGLVNCVLNRYTARLAPGIMVHMASNLLAVVVLVASVN